LFLLLLLLEECSYQLTQMHQHRINFIDWKK